MDDNDFEMRCARVSKCVSRQPLNRAALVSILEYCRVERARSDIEASVGSLPEATGALQSVSRLVDQLVRAGGLSSFDIACDGSHVSDEDKRGLTEDEIDDMVYGQSFLITDAACEVLSSFEPESRIARLTQKHPERLMAYREVLARCEHPQSWNSLEGFIVEKDLLSSFAASEQLQPSVLVDQLESAGLLVWKKGWLATEEGRGFACECR